MYLHTVHIRTYVCNLDIIQSFVHAYLRTYVHISVHISYILLDSEDVHNFPYVTTILRHFSTFWKDYHVCVLRYVCTYIHTYLILTLPVIKSVILTSSFPSQSALEDHFSEEKRTAVGYQMEMEAYKTALDEVMSFIQDPSQLAHPQDSPQKVAVSPSRLGRSASTSVVMGSQDRQSTTPKRPVWIGGMVSDGCRLS